MHNEYNYRPAQAAELEVASMPPKIPLRDYKYAMEQMKAKGYSYQEVTDWICEFLGATVTRSQVIYVITTPSIVQEEDEKSDYYSDIAEDLSLSPIAAQSEPSNTTTSAKKTPRGKKKAKK